MFSIEQNQCYVFGANATGFHGAGGAGNAFMGEKGNSWRTNSDFQLALKALNAMKSGAKYNSADLIGKYAVLGQVHFMEGLLGYSYGIITTQDPGKQGFVDSTYLLRELKKMLECVNSKPNLTFVCSNFGLKRPMGFSWWSKDEMKNLWTQAMDGKPLPSNLIPPKYVLGTNGQPSTAVVQEDFFTNM